MLLPLWRFGSVGSLPDVRAERAAFSSPGAAYGAKRRPCAYWV